MKKTILLLCNLSLFLVSNAIHPEGLWNISSENQLSIPGQRKLQPEKFLLAQLDTKGFGIFQSMIPSEESGLTSTIMLPTPDGSFQTFKIFECPMMEKPLADKYPQIKTYTGINVDNPLITAKMDFTVFGFHAKVFNGQSTYFIDPYTDLSTDWYLVYYKSDYKKPLKDRMTCHTEESQDLLPKSVIPLTNHEFTCHIL
ncbi:MAG: hypothetical protein IPJ31_06335 [Bacteroidetes bacterium]|nr:hypothetical protein [Bacteroidota bacterium]